MQIFIETLNGGMKLAGTVEPGDSIDYWFEPTAHKYRAECAMTNEVVQFYTKGAAIFWLTCRALNRM